MKRLLLVAIVSHLLYQPIAAQGFGNWQFAANGLPVYQYTGPLPVRAVDKEGKDAMLPDDPYFLLGNYRLTLFTHASGVFQFMSGERAWARINAAPAQANYGWNEASLTVKNQKTRLTGLKSLAADPTKAQKHFGVGFARYAYQLANGLSCTRTLSVKPSLKINTGTPAFVVTVTLHNAGSKIQEVAYAERMLVNYVLCGTQFTPAEKRPLLYHNKTTVEADKRLAVASLTFTANTLLALPGKDARYQFDINPPAVFMAGRGSGAGVPQVSSSGDTLAATLRTTLARGETKTLHVVIGRADFQNFPSASAQVDDLLRDAETANPAEGLFATQWKKRLPDLSAEKDEVLRREMLWNAHVVEASATYRDYYKATFIPQGTVYAYHFGDNISNRDHLAAALPACYTNPELAKSSIRYVIMHSETDGEIKRGDGGFGYSPPTTYKESDEQLYFFNTLAEYLLITKDYGFLNEQAVYYPAEDRKTDAVLTILKKYFVYLRDEIGTGQTGLVKILHSDWSDSFFHEYSPDRYSWSAESHLNSAMVLAVFPKLMEALKQSGNPEATAFIAALESYRAGIETVYMKDLGERNFSARAYLNYKIRFGTDNVCLEPQGYLLQIPTLSAARKQAIYAEVKSKILAPEKVGFRTRQRQIGTGKPDGEDGGIWYSIEYPVLLGVATFDKAEAWALLKRFSFDTFARTYPNYWVGQWTAPDDLNSALSTREGLYSFWEPDLRRAFQGYCSHPHIWPLFTYFKLRQFNEAPPQPAHAARP